MSPSTMNAARRWRTPDSPPVMRESPAQRRDRLRARSGAAYRALQTSRKRIAAALSVDPTAVSHRRAGQGPFGAVLCELDELEREGVDTTPLLVAALATVLDARAARPTGTHPATLALVLAEQEADGAEDLAQVAFVADPCPETAAEYRRALVEHLGRATLVIHDLERMVER